MLDWLKDFKPPKNKVELLERALEYGSAEERWAQGSLCTYQGQNDFGPSGEETDEELCTSVGACLIGILCIAHWNGPFVRHQIMGDLHPKFKNGASSSSPSAALIRFDELQNNGQIFVGAVKAVYDALPEGWREGLEGSDLCHADRVREVEHYNDYSCPFNWRADNRKHSEIVEVLTRAVEIAKK